MIQLELGKYYRVRNPQWVQEGQQIVKISRRIDVVIDGFKYLGDDGYKYKDNGRFRKDETDSDYDLVEEVEP